MWRIVFIFFIIILIGVLQPFDITFTESFVVPNNPVTYNWYQGNIHKTHVYSGTQPGDSHTFDPSGQYVKDIGSKDYVDCRNQGFTKEFCLETPVARNEPGSCMCPNGQLGRRLPGFKGKCVCNNDTFTANYI